MSRSCSPLSLVACMAAAGQLECFFLLLLIYVPNVAAEWSEFLFAIRDVLGSDIGTGTGYPHVRFFVVFLVQMNAGIVIKSRLQ
jgi:hypothetical protein